MKFKFIGRGVAKGCPKDWLDVKYRRLPYQFSLIKNINLFTPSVRKRMRSVKTDGVVIPLRRGRDYFVGLQAIDKKQRNAKKKSEAAELRMLGKKLKAYENKAWLKAFVETLSRTMKLSKNRNIIPKPVSLLYSRMWMWYSSLGH